MKIVTCKLRKYLRKYLRNLEVRLSVRKFQHGSRRSFLFSAGAMIGGAFTGAPASATTRAIQDAHLKSGIDRTAMDPTVRPQDDFYRYAVGGWIEQVRPPAYMPSWSASRALQLSVYEALNRDISALGATLAPSTNEVRLFDLYTAYMDEAGIDHLGLVPVQPYLAAFDSAASPTDIVRQIANLAALGLDIGLGLWVHADDEAPSRYLADIVQSDLGLPTRNSFVGDDLHSVQIREDYRAHVEIVLRLSGQAQAESLSTAILTLEMCLAQAQWTEVARRVPGATSHRVSRDKLAILFTGLDLATYADMIGIPASVTLFNLSEPDYFAAYGKALIDTPLVVWKAYLRYRLLDHLSRFLPAPFRNEADRFWTLTFSGASGARPRWLRAMSMIEDAMGDAMGQLYVRKHFPPTARLQADALLKNVIKAFKNRVKTSAWMNDTSKAAAQKKLDQLVVRMGAPDHIRDYSALRTAPNDAVGNWLRARALLARQETDKLSRPVDRTEWTMSAQSVNGYYSVSRNQVVLPAALLQPPYFQVDADDAVNYGGLGFFVAHELTHAFDRAGSQYDGTGKRVEWMTTEDRAEFERRTQRLIAQYGRYEIAPGHFLNGELTVGENIADNSGLAIALEAYQLSLKGKPARVLDGLTGIQRFYLEFARTWASEPINTPADIAAASEDTHAPDELRVKGALSNQTEFYKAFKVEPHDGMYLPPNSRTTIW